MPMLIVKCPGCAENLNYSIEWDTNEYGLTTLTMWVCFCECGWGDQRIPEDAKKPND